MISKFIRGKELLERWNIVELDLFHSVSAGKLKPYDKTGKPLPHPYYNLEMANNMLRAHSLILDKQEELLDGLPDRYEDAKNIPKEVGYAVAYLQQGFIRWSEKNTRKYYEALSRDFLGWLGCELPDNKKIAENLLEILKESLYLYEEFLSVDKEVRRMKSEKITGAIGSRNQGKRLRKSQIHKLNARAVAAELWERDPNITIAEMIISDEITNACEGKVYGEKTLRNWIKDLCPNRLPGRRPKAN